MGKVHKLHCPGKKFNEVGGEINFEVPKIFLEVSEVSSCFLYFPLIHSHLWGEIIMKQNFPFDIESRLPSVAFHTFHIIFFVGHCSLAKIHGDPEWLALGNHSEY